MRYDFDLNHEHCPTGQSQHTMQIPLDIEPTISMFSQGSALQAFTVPYAVANVGISAPSFHLYHRAADPSSSSLKLRPQALVSVASGWYLGCPLCGVTHDYAMGSVEWVGNLVLVGLPLVNYSSDRLGSSAFGRLLVALHHPHRQLVSRHPSHHNLESLHASLLGTRNQGSACASLGHQPPLLWS